MPEFAIRAMALAAARRPRGGQRVALRVAEAVARLRANDTVLTRLHLDGEHVWARCRGAVLRGRTVRTCGGVGYEVGRGGCLACGRGGGEGVGRVLTCGRCGWAWGAFGGRK